MECSLQVQKQTSTDDLAGKIAENYGIISYQIYHAQPVSLEDSDGRYGSWIYESGIDLRRLSDPTPLFFVDLKRTPEEARKVREMWQKPATDFVIGSEHPSINQENFRLAVEQARQELGGTLK